MQLLSRSLGRLCLVLLAGFGTAMLADPALAAGARPLSSPFFSRWAISEKKPVFTARGRLYKTVDIAACGRDFCGVSVSDSGACGPTLFRFLASHAGGDDVLHGHGRWGDQTKNIQIYWSELSEYGDHSALEIYLGDDHDFGGRSDSMPKFHSEYRRAGAARCRAA